MTVESNTPPGGRPIWRRLRRRHQVVLVLALALALAALAWTWRHPSTSFRNGYGIEMTRDVGFTVWAPLADSDEPAGSTVTFTRLEPVFRQDGAKATVEYIVCELDPAVLERDGVGGFGYGLPTRYVERYCRTTRPAEGADLVLGSANRQELLVGITATRPGRTVITRHHVTYRVGWRRGSTDIAVSARLDARPSR